MNDWFLEEEQIMEEGSFVEEVGLRWRNREGRSSVVEFIVCCCKFQRHKTKSGLVKVNIIVIVMVGINTVKYCEILWELLYLDKDDIFLDIYSSQTSY